MVTSTGSGLAVPDWPLSYGQYFPRMVGGVLFEHGHRMTAAVVGTMTFVLAAWIWLREKSVVLRRLAAAAALGIVVQALLGGITVLYLLPKEISIAHACLGQAVFCVLLAIAQLTAPSHGVVSSSADEGFWRAGAFAACVIYLQLLLGAVFRHTGTGLAWHLAGALAVLGTTFNLYRKTFREFAHEPALTGPASLLATALPVQLILGGVSYLARVELLGTGGDPHPGYWIALIATAHLALGAFMLGTAVIWTLRAGLSTQHFALSARRLSAYLELTKPRIVMMVVLTAALGYCLAGGASRALLAWTLAATGLAACATGALNQLMEIEQDRLMRRTRTRPLPEGRLTFRQANIFGLATAVAALVLFAWKVNFLSCALCAVTIVAYLLVYTPMKTRTPQSTWAGAVAGAMPPLIGWAAARGSLSAEAWALFAIQFLWQIPHFLAIFWIHREEYARAGFRVMSVVDPDGSLTSFQIAIHSLALFAAGLVPVFLGMTDLLYGYGALALGAGLLGLGLKASWTMALPDTRRLFLATLLYLPALLAVMALTRA